MAAPVLDTRASWNGVILGGFTIGTSLIGGSDTISSVWSGVFGGTYDNLGTGGQDLVESVSWRRGRTNLLTGLLAGEGEIVLNDPTGIYNPKNPGSPLAGLLVPLRPVYIKASDGLTTYGGFRGFIREYVHAAGPPATTTLKLVDLFVILAQTSPVIAATGATTTGAAIGLVLDSIGLTETSLRSLNTGDVIPDFSADGSRTALQLIGDLLAAERGTFFIDGSGVATYRDRYDRARRRTADGTVNGTATKASSGSSLENVKNRARVTRTGGVQKEWFDTTSVGLYGYRDFDDITTPYLQTDDDALTLAKRLVQNGKDPRSPLWSCDSVSADQPMLTQMLARELGQRILIPPGGAGASGTQGSFHIEQLNVTVQGGEARCSWVLTERLASDDVFLIGVSLIGSTDPFTL